MNSAFAYTDSAAIQDQDDIKTFPDKAPVPTLARITRQRIDSFFNEPSAEPDDVEQGKKESSNMTATQSSPAKKKTPIAFVPKTIYHPRTFSSLQKWEGYVIEVHEDCFIARITDLSDEYEDEEIEVMFTEISEDDKKLVCPGAIFYWHIGYETEKGTVKRSSVIRFRRMPRWTESDIEKAKDFENQMKRFLNI